jgi:hypothetical protein
LENDDLLIPALWINDNSLIAYSKRGYENKEWKLPEGWKNAKKVKIRKIDSTGKKLLAIQNISSGKLQLTVGKDEMLLLEK